MYFKEFEVRWADIDALQHLRHTAYNDYATQTRLRFMADHGFGMDWCREHKIFPVLLREETVFQREVRYQEYIRIDMRLLKMRSDGSRWTVVHRLFKPNEVEAARITVDAGWIDAESRKLIHPPLSLIQLFSKLEKCEGFELTRSEIF
jgi:acyl-CoA thioester hydrolase